MRICIRFTLELLLTRSPPPLSLTHSLPTFSHFSPLTHPLQTCRFHHPTFYFVSLPPSPLLSSSLFSSSFFPPSSLSRSIYLLRTYLLPRHHDASLVLLCYVVSSPRVQFYLTVSLFRFLANYSNFLIS